MVIQRVCNFVFTIFATCFQIVFSCDNLSCNHDLSFHKKYCVEVLLLRSSHNIDNLVIDLKSYYVHEFITKLA